MDNQAAQAMKNVNRKYLIIIVVAILLLIGGIFYLTSKNSQRASLSGTKITPGPLPKEVTVRLTKTGFRPSTVTIEKGGAVRWINESGESNSTVNSNPHPVNNEHKELNLGAFNGSTLVHIFTQADTYGYHDYFHPEWKGTVVVK